MRSFLQDIRFAMRQMRAAPAFGAMVIATLALSIGITAAVFSVLYAMVIRPLPYQQPERIVSLNTRAPNGYSQEASYPEYLDWRRMNHSFSSLAGYVSYHGVNFESAAGPTALHAVRTTDNFFDVFGVNPVVGRTFAAGEDQDGKNDVVVLSYEVWQQYFGGATSAVGQHVKLDGRSYTVIGVMPAGFRFPISTADAIYTPLHLTRFQAANRGNHWLQTVARLKPRVTAQSAEADLRSVFTNLGRNDPDNKGRDLKLVELATYVVGKTDSSLRLLLYAVLVLLAIGCVNVAGLLLARGVKREREIALRTAVCAARSRIVRQMLTEALLFAVGGGAGGVLLAYGLLRAIRLLLISALSRGAEVHVNTPVLAAALIVAVTVTIIAALLPAFRLSAVAPSLTLKSGGSAGTSRGQHRLRASFVITQVALALVLLVVAGLLMRMLGALRNTELGFSPDYILTAEVDLSEGQYEGRDVMADFYRPLMDRVQAIPGVTAVGIIQMLPIQDWGWNAEIHIVGLPVIPKNIAHDAETRFVSRGYYDVFQDQLVRGRLTDPALDTPKTRLVTVVNESFVKRFIPPGRDPIGMQIGQDDITDTSPEADNPRMTIVGVVKDIRQNLYNPPVPQYEFSLSQLPRNVSYIVSGHMHLVVRTLVKPESIVPSLRRAFHDTDPALPFRTPETMRSIVADVLTFERLENWLFGAFAAAAMLLAVVGLYGLISHEVELSTRDIGVRLALGASRERILTGIYRRVAWMLGGGVAAGLILSAAARNYINSVVALHGSQDALPVLAMTTALVLAGLVAAFFPAVRASAVEPMDALRDE